ncbi:hypothetical protein [Streptomyces sp. NPDC006285]|uniref:hypothetical protein n=1 Tax=Streptomyces sp. NPDC006285 TaxID=3364742 RepID=UPI0036B5A146
MTLKPIRIEDMGNEQRQAFAGLTNVVAFEVPEATAARIREVHNGLLLFMRAYAQAIRPAIEQMSRSLQALRETGLIDETGHPTRPRDRPAHQSPYGPAHRRRT